MLRSTVGSLLFSTACILIGFLPLAPAIAATPPLIDVALNMPASSDSVVWGQPQTGSYGPAKAFDGIVDTGDQHRFCSDTGGSSHWLQVDLQAAHLIYNFRLASGRYAGLDPLTDFEIQIKQNAADAFQTIPQTVVQGNTQADLTFNLTPPVSARYVRLVCKTTTYCRVRELYVMGVTTAGPAPTLPTVQAGANQTLTLPMNSVTLTGTALPQSTQPATTISTVSWSEVSGPSISLPATNLYTLPLTQLVQGTYTFKFTATDSRGLQAASSVMVTVNPAPTTTPSITTQWPVGTTSSYYGYIEYLPQNYAANPTTLWPLILFLHGKGEEGNGSSGLSAAGNLGPNLRTRQGVEFPALILTPQSAGWWDATKVSTFIDYAIAHYRIDPKRVYVTGLSMGGGGALDVAAIASQKIAAIVPMSPTAGQSAAALRNIAEVAIWAFHNRGDNYVPFTGTVATMNAIGATRTSTNTCLGAYDYTTTLLYTTSFDFTKTDWVLTPGAVGASKWNFTVPPIPGHDSWSAGYQEQPMWDWLFLQHK